MRKGDIQLGQPMTHYTDTKDNIEAMDLPDGSEAYGYTTDPEVDGEWGRKINGVWVWGDTGDGYTPPTTTAANDFQVGDGSGNWITKTLAQVVTILRTVLDGVYAAITHDHDTDYSDISHTHAHSALTGIGTGDHHAENHSHGGSPTQKLVQANTHESPDTDSGTSSLHHTIGAGANQAAAGNHSHAHSALTGIGANDHHNQSHDHSASGDGQSLAPAGTFSLTGDITPSTLSGNVNDYNPTGWSTASVIRVASDTTPRTITGLQGGADGRVAILINIGSTYNVVLASESASSSAANRFSFGSGDFNLAPGRAIALIYDATASRWRPLVVNDHTQMANIGNYSHAWIDSHIDSTHLAFSDGEGTPADLSGSSNVDGTSAYAARRDHAHQGFKDSEGDPAAIGTAADGTSGYAARRDHVHALTNSQSVLGSVFNITNAAGSFQDTGLSISLPSAGTYEILADVRCVLKANGGAGTTAWWISVELYNSTDSAAVTNSERLGVLTGVNAQLFQTTTPISIPITVAGAKTIKLYACRNGNGTPAWTTSDIESNSAGRTVLSYKKTG